MKSLTNYIYESINDITEQFQTNGSNKNGMFLHKDGLRQSEDFSFNPGEKALCIAYDTDGYRIQIRGILEIAKVLKSSIKVKATTDDGTEIYNKMKFDTKDDANKYAENLKAEVSKLNVEVKEEKVEEKGEITTIERADSILKDIAII